VARSELLQQDVLTRCLRERWIAAAALDVSKRNPYPRQSLMGLDSVILTPHWLPATRQADRATNSSIVEGMLRVAKRQIPDQVLDHAVLDQPCFRAKLNRFAQ